MRLRLSKLNTLRNQILIVFIVVMSVVLSIVGFITFNIVGNLLKNNAENQIQQTAIQANGRYESLYQNIDMLSNQFAANPAIQQLLLLNVTGEEINYIQKQSIRDIANSIQAFSDGINSFELYTIDGNRVYPLDDINLSVRVDHSWVEKADKADGGLVWIGDDPSNVDSFLAIRKVRLMNHWYSNGGYVLVRINKPYLQFQENMENLNDEYMLLADRNGKIISTNLKKNNMEEILKKHNENVTIKHRKYIAVNQHSEVTGWNLMILTPISKLTSGLSTLQTAISLSGIVGFIIFLVASILISTLITRPIQRLTKTMRRARNGELKTNPDIFSPIEITELNQTYNNLVENTNHLIQEVFEKELIRSRTELKALQAQINPHFLYNTLNALYWSLEEKGEEELAEFVVALSDLFRYTISTPNHDGWVTLEDEIVHIERYMQIMKMRLGDRLEWKISTPAEFKNVRIPKLLIQPLVENAILHGVEPKSGTGTVSIVVEKLTEFPALRVTIEDDGPGIEERVLNEIIKSLETGGVSSLKGSGVAIANVNKRLSLYYENALIKNLKIESKVGKGTKVYLELPLNGGNS